MARPPRLIGQGKCDGRCGGVLIDDILAVKTIMSHRSVYPVDCPNLKAACGDAVWIERGVNPQQNRHTVILIVLCGSENSIGGRCTRARLFPLPDGFTGRQVLKVTRRDPRGVIDGHSPDSRELVARRKISRRYAKTFDQLFRANMAFGHMASYSRIPASMHVPAFAEALYSPGRQAPGEQPMFTYMGLERPVVDDAGAKL